MKSVLTADHYESLRRLDTCTVSNAIETFQVRLRNEGFTDSSVHCMFPRSASMVGNAVTAKIRCLGPPVEGHAYLERTDWWNAILAVPAPRVIVIEDIDKSPGKGALLGEVHANILAALDCVGAVTNGAVRDLPAVDAMGFYLFAHNAAVSHSYVHIGSIGEPVVVGGLTVRTGDLLLGDCHGVLSVPRDVAPEIPAAVKRIRERERKIIGLCRAPNFSLEKLRRLVSQKT